MPQISKFFPRLMSKSFPRLMRIFNSRETLQIWKVIYIKYRESKKSASHLELKPMETPSPITYSN